MVPASWRSGHTTNSWPRGATTRNCITSRPRRIVDLLRQNQFFPRAERQLLLQIVQSCSWVALRPIVTFSSNCFRQPLRRIARFRPSAASGRLRWIRDDIRPRASDRPLQEVSSWRRDLKAFVADFERANPRFQRRSRYAQSHGRTVRSAHASLAFLQGGLNHVLLLRQELFLKVPRIIGDRFLRKNTHCPARIPPFARKLFNTVKPPFASSSTPHSFASALKGRFQSSGG